MNRKVAVAPWRKTGQESIIMTFEGYPGHGGLYEPSPVSDEPHQPAMTAVPLPVAVARRIAERKAEAHAERERQEAKAQEQREQAAAAAMVDWLAATFNVVELMTERQARIVYDALIGRPLAVHDADLLQMVAQRLGITITWQHIDLAPGSQWEEGRGT